MSNGDDEHDEEAPAEAGDEDALALSDAEEFESRLDDVAEAIESAEIEADLDEVEPTLDRIAEAFEATDLPEPDDEDAEDPNEAIAERVEDLRANLEEARGPYAEDVASALGETAGTIRETRWTDDGLDAVESIVETFLDTASDLLDDTFAVLDPDPDVLADGLDSVASAVEGAGLDPDEDSETIESLLAAADELDEGVEAAESWEDLTVREQLDEEGFYDVLTSERRKDFPPEWSAIKLYEKRYQATGDEEAVEYILMALDTLPGGNDHFMQENVLDSLERIAPPQALDALVPLATRRNEQAIRVMGKIGDPEALDTILTFIDGDGDVALQLATLEAVGAIGSEEATQTVANRLVADDDDVRSAAARTLGRIGDTRAIDPLTDVLGDETEVDGVRASAAWALTQIGTGRALDVVTDHADDPSYLVQVEAKKADLSA